MLIDLDLESPGDAYRSEICVLGAGVAGLVLATSLGRRGFKVNLLEAGGLELEERSQDLYRAEMAGLQHTGTMAGRFRVFGGSSTRWGGQLLPYPHEIFSPPPGAPSRSWPIRPEAIEQYYPEVLALMGADDLPFTAELLPALGQPQVPFGEAIQLRFSKWAPFARRNLAPSLGSECIASANVTVFVHANAVALEPDASGGRIVALQARNYAGATFTFAAARFVVCMGTIESSRLLLASGVGNRHDQVGRYFHDHISMRAAGIEGAARSQVLKRLGPFFVANTLHTCKLEASPALRDRERLAAVMAHVVLEEPEDSGIAAVRDLLRSLQRRDFRAALARNLLPMLRGFGDVARLIWYSRIRKRRAVSRRARVSLNIDCEQVPRAESRIRLSDATDALGQRKAVVEWSISDQDRDTASRFAHFVKAELERVGIAPLSWLPGVLDRANAPPPMVDTFHPMGGLRAGATPDSSVVDTDLKVHGVENLWVASCSVFPSGGSSNPTFTLMALTLRLAAHLAAS